MASELLTISDLIAERMSAKRLTDGAVAKAAGVDRVTILRYRSGATLPRVEHGKAICRALGISPARFLDAAERQARGAA